MYDDVFLSSGDERVCVERCGNGLMDKLFLQLHDVIVWKCVGEMCEKKTDVNSLSRSRARTFLTNSY